MVHDNRSFCRSFYERRIRWHGNAVSYVIHTVCHVIDCYHLTVPHFSRAMQTELQLRDLDVRGLGTSALQALSVLV